MGKLILVWQTISIILIIFKCKQTVSALSNWAFVFTYVVEQSLHLVNVKQILINALKDKLQFRPRELPSLVSCQVFSSILFFACFCICGDAELWLQVKCQAFNIVISEVVISHSDSVINAELYCFTLRNVCYGFFFSIEFKIIMLVYSPEVLLFK